MPDSTFVNRHILIDTAKHLTVTTTHTVIKNDLIQSILDSNGFKIFFPLAVTLIIFFLGQALAVYFKKKDRKTLLQNSKFNLETWVVLLQNTVNILTECCQKFSKELSSQNHVQRVELGYTPTLVNKISELNVTDFLNYCTLNLQGDNEANSKRAFEIIHGIEYLKSVEGDIREKYQKFTSTVDDLIDEFNKADREFTESLGSFFTATENSQEEGVHEFAININEFLNQWHVPGKDYQDVDVWQNEFINPFLTLIQQEVTKNPKSEYSGRFYHKLRAIQDVFTKWKATQTGYSTLLKEYGESYNKCYGNLKKNIETLRKCELVNVWMIR